MSNPSPIYLLSWDRDETYLTKPQSYESKNEPWAHPTDGLEPWPHGDEYEEQDL